jgi:D-beta-D-heptose 7-phosphate kinase/D-beta-D-heptose 1-phosphate adenosyltransferase
MPLPRERIVELTSRATERRIVVLGDVMLDRYVVGETDRLSPEAPVPVVTVRETRSALGGAANVAANVVAIGARCSLVGVIGDDPNGAAIRAALRKDGLDDRHLLTVPGRPTTTKTRVIARTQQVVRIDEEVDTALDRENLERLLALALQALESADALLLEDYNKGTLVPPLIGELIEHARRRGTPVVVDPKFRHFFDYRGATVFKPNRRELEAALGASTTLAQRDQVPQVLAEAREWLGVENLLLTLGAEGMLLATTDGRVMQIPGLARQVFDVSGAGDTVTAWVGTMLAAGATVPEAAELANYAAGIEVTKLGVATVHADEVLALHEHEHDRLGRLRRGGAI